MQARAASSCFSKSPQGRHSDASPCCHQTLWCCMGLHAALDLIKSGGSCPSGRRYLYHAHCARQLRMRAGAWTLPGGLQAARRRQRMRAQSVGALSDESAGGHASTSSEPAGISTGAGAAGRDGKAKAGAWLRQRFFSRLQASSGHESDDSDATSRASSSNDLQVKGLGLWRGNGGQGETQHGLQSQCWPGSMAHICDCSRCPWTVCPCQMTSTLRAAAQAGRQAGRGSSVAP